MIIKEYFSSDGYWTAPPTVHQVMVIGIGGGQGGNGGINGLNGIDTGGVTAGAGAFGGNGSIMSSVVLDVVPEAVYEITIGMGGVGGEPGQLGLDGENTKFGSLYTWIGALQDSQILSFGSGGMGGWPYTPSAAQNGRTNIGGLTVGGLAGEAGEGTLEPVNTNCGGGGGGGGCSNSGVSGVGNGGKGGDEKTGVGFSVNGTSGGSADANSGNGGGGGGGGAFDGDSTVGTGGSGGNGGSGFLYIIY